MDRRIAAAVFVLLVGGATLVLPGDLVSSAATLGRAPSTITVTEQDNGHSYRLQEGGTLVVDLSGPSQMNWTEPESSAATVLERTSGSSGTSATAKFDALSKGKAQVSATGTPVCSKACPQFLLLFRITVSVVG